MENNKEIKNKTITGLFWRFGERITAQLISFVVSMVLARILMPEEYGLVSLVTIFITLANVFTTNRLGTAFNSKKRSR
ncbi:MAG: oligosaccharide flippase family protein [Clostridia bacterium]